MNIYVLFSLLLFLAPGGCPIYSIDLSTLEVPNDFQNELTLQSMLSSELHQYRSRLNSNADVKELTAAEHFELAHPQGLEDLLHGSETTSYADEPEPETETQSSKVYRSASEEATFLGTNLFGTYPKKCFSAEDIALMSARKDFEMLIPKSYPQCLLHDGIVYTLMKYFNSVNQVIKRMSDVESRRLLQRAFYDALGGYLRFYLVPVAQVSYYAGRLKLCTVERLVALYRQCLLVLNTHGNGWKTPVADVLSQLKSVQIKPIKLNGEKSSENDASSCALLDQNCVNEDAQREQMIVPLPHLESEDSSGFLNNIFLPFKHRRIYNLRSPDSAFILVKFFKTLNNCYRFQGISPKTYNHKLRNWIRESLQLHYRDEAFYPGLGGVLQIYEALAAPTKSPEPTEPNDEPVMGEDDCKDYPSSSDEVNKDFEKTRKDNETAESRKESRSLRHGLFARHGPRDASHQREDDEAKEPSEANEECVDCDEESYIVYIVAFLALLLFILLMTICCCLRSRTKKIPNSATTPKPTTKADRRAKEKSSDKNVADVEAQPPPPPPKTDDNQSCWSNLFRSRKQKKGLKNKLVPTSGMGLMGNHDYDSYSMKLNHLDKFMSHKRGSTTEQRYELESLSSNSSLSYQFNRKFVPLKYGREKRDDYCPKSDRKRSKQASYVIRREREREREREKERRPQKPTTLAEEMLPVKKEAASKETAKADDDVRQLYTRMKHKRQEGGLTNITTESEMIPVDSEMSRKTYNVPSRSQENQDKPIIHSPTDNPSCSFDAFTPPQAISKSLTDNNQEILSMPQSTPCQSSAPQEPSNYAASWETLDEEDSK